MNWVELIITHCLVFGLGMTIQALKTNHYDADTTESACAKITLGSFALLVGYELSRLITP